jgi:hypothetical protein
MRKWNLMDSERGAKMETGPELTNASPLIGLQVIVRREFETSNFHTPTYPSARTSVQSQTHMGIGCGEHPSRLILAELSGSRS